jgi:hypothetical protein
VEEADQVLGPPDRGEQLGLGGDVERVRVQLDLADLA